LRGPVSEPARPRLAPPPAPRRRGAAARGRDAPPHRAREYVPLLARILPEVVQLEAAVSRKIAHFVEFVGQGRGSKALAEALMLAEKKAEALMDELDALRRAQQPEVRMPPLVWIEERVAGLQRISAEVRQLRGLDLSLSRIAASLDVSDKTAAKALAWADERGDVAPILAPH
jgi:hypothetical protein